MLKIFEQPQAGLICELCFTKTCFIAYPSNGVPIIPNGLLYSDHLIVLVYPDSPIVSYLYINHPIG